MKRPEGGPVNRQEKGQDHSPALRAASPLKVERQLSIQGPRGDMCGMVKRSAAMLKAQEKPPKVEENLWGCRVPSLSEGVAGSSSNRHGRFTFEETTTLASQTFTQKQRQVRP